MRMVRITVNGEAIEQAVEPRLSLADFLREHLRLTGTHLGCEHGVCGACTVMLDDKPVRSCITLAVAADGARVRSIEGFDEDPQMALLRRCFNEAHALQCGFCTPGMLVIAHDILTRLPHADRARIKAELAGNLCRCTGYLGAVNAIARALGERSSGG